MMQNKLENLITAIFQAAMGEEEKSTQTPEETKALFDRLSVAAQTQDLDFFRQLVEAEKQKDRQESEPTLLMAAILEGKVDIVRVLIAAGADVNAIMKQFFTFDALNLAISEGYADIVQILLDAGADPNLHNESPGLSNIVGAIRQNNAEIVRILIAGGAAVKFETGFRILVYAAENSTAEIVQILIDAGCNVNTKNAESGGDTPLTAACKRADIEIIKTLVAAGANVNKIGMHEFAPIVALFYAPTLNQMLGNNGLAEKDENIADRINAILKILLDAGADLNARDLQGKTPLMLAIAQNQLDSAKIIIDAEADVNALSQPDDTVIFFFRGDGNSVTALHIATQTNNLEAVKMLLEAGANPNIVDRHGKKTIDIAREKGFTDLIETIPQT